MTWPRIRANQSAVALILIIDDDETVREGVEETARRMGHEVLTAESGEKVL